VALAGRTDAGVHARGQVAAFSTGSRHAAKTIVRAANALLPRDICVRRATEVELTFDPRRQATSRWYRYTLLPANERLALQRNFVWQVMAQLDLNAMAEAAQALVGRHDFAAFTAPSVVRRRRTERVVMSAILRRERNLLLFDIEANAFLQHMVRRIVGALMKVGCSRGSVEEFAALVGQGRPGAASFMAPARGLCLMKVRYESGLFADEQDENI
jgi:tRNA pseudouridine38-40 synthase